MTEQHWNTLCAVIRGEQLNLLPAGSNPLPTGFIIDSPWLPNWAGHSILEYFTNDDVWLKANLHAINTFPEAIFLPGFWSEYGMCTEPSAFGAVNVWEEDEFPFAKPILHSVEDVDRLERPNARTDGLLPFVIKRLQHMQPAIEEAGHAIRFAVARGPLNMRRF
jgi:uroporphyrinogen decarboxylase